LYLTKNSVAVQCQPTEGLLLKQQNGEQGEAYFSLKLCCSCCSAAEKNSSISSELGMNRQFRVSSVLRREVVELLLVLLLVVDPGVLIISGFLIRLHGVVSLVLLQPKRKHA
jgi:hypothetical protein